MEFENVSSVKASRRRRTPVSINASTSAFTFSTPASANTTGALVERVAPRVASSSTATLVAGANVSATRHARTRYARLPRCTYQAEPPARVVARAGVNLGAIAAAGAALFALGLRALRRYPTTVN